MAQYFDVNRPIPGGRNTILGIINDPNGYSTPEAAESDFQAHAPQGMDYLKNEYQRLTGDWFADPFKDSIDARARAMTAAATQGASVSVGGPMGPQIIPTSLPSLMPQQQQQQSRVPASAPYQGPIPMRPDAEVATSQPSVRPQSNRGYREYSNDPQIAREQIAQQMEEEANLNRARGQQYQIPTAPTESDLYRGPADVQPPMAATGDAPDISRIPQIMNRLITGDLQNIRGVQTSGAPVYNVPTPNAGTDFQSLQQVRPATQDLATVLGKRASAYGVYSEFQKIKDQYPELMQYAGGDDPRFARTDKGRAIADPNLPELANHPYFRSLMDQDPQKASRLYKTLTNGDLRTDIDAKIAANQASTVARRELLRNVHGVEADPITGQRFIVVEKPNAVGEMEQHRAPMTPEISAAFDREGGVSKYYDIKLPGEGGLTRPPGWDDTKMAKYVQYAEQTRQKFPNLPISQISQIAKAGVDAEGRATDQATPSNLMNKLIDFGMKAQPENMLVAPANAGIATSNFLKSIMNVPPREYNSMMALFHRPERSPLIPDLPWIGRTMGPEEKAARERGAAFLKANIPTAVSAYNQ